MNPQPTPGPWIVWKLAPDSDPQERLIVTTADGDEEICGIVHRKEDAPLIAAAPELLAALRPLLFEVEQILISTQHFPECAVKCSRRAAVELARAALAKATAP